TVAVRALPCLVFVELRGFAGLPVLDVGDGDTAIGAALHFPDLVLEAPQAGHGAVVDHHVVAQHAHMAVAPGHAVGHQAAGHPADLGDPEDLLHLGDADGGLLTLGRQHAGHDGLDVVHQVVDDRIVANLDAF